MEQWQLDFEWLRVRHWFQERLGLERLPDLQGILFLIGIQELGQVRPEYTKEEKQDLMHMAVCRLLSMDGYAELEGYDDEGWAHWKITAAPPYKGLEQQETWLKGKIIEYVAAVEQS